MIVHLTESEWLYCPSEKIERKSYMTKKKATTGMETTLGPKTKSRFTLDVVN